VDGMFPEPDAEAIEARVREGSCAESRKDVGLALMRNFGTMDIAAWFSGAGVPIRAINAAEPNPTEVETNRKYADFDAVLVPDVGHYLQMTRPGEFNPLLLDAVAEILSATPREAEAPAP